MDHTEGGVGWAGMAGHDGRGGTFQLVPPDQGHATLMQTPSQPNGCEHKLKQQLQNVNSSRSLNETFPAAHLPPLLY